LFSFAALMMCQCVLSLRADVHYIAVASDRHGPEDEDDWEDYDINRCSVVLGLSGITNKVEYVCLDGDMVGSKGGSEDRSELYLGNNDYLYYPSLATGREVNIGSFRAYFQLKGDLKAQASSSNGVKAFRLNFGEDETTSIRLVNPSSIDEKSNNCYYMLDGRRLNGRPTEKGVYILNGRKIVIH